MGRTIVGLWRRSLHGFRAEASRYLCEVSRAERRSSASARAILSIAEDELKTR
jgi:hypothetical protein